MATRFSSFDFKKNGPQHLKDNIDIALVVKDVLKSDNYAATLAKAIASTAMTGTDVAITVSGEDCLTTINAKSDIDPSGTATALEDIAVAYCDSVGGEVILVVDATDRVTTNEVGDVIGFPAAQHFSRETTAVAV